MRTATGAWRVIRKIERIMRHIVRCFNYSCLLQNTALIANYLIPIEVCMQRKLGGDNTDWLV